MNYGGWYKEHAIPFLKMSLYQAYVTEQAFYGGRGPLQYIGTGFVYRNEPAGTFESFHGHESITEFSRMVGYHWYRGYSLLKDHGPTPILLGPRQS